MNHGTNRNYRRFFLAIASSALAENVKQNVIVILTDDQGYGDLSCHGNPILKSPELERLLQESNRLADFERRNLAM